MLKMISGYKTYMIAFLMVMVGAINLVSGDTSLDQFLQSEHLRLLLEGFGFWFLRAGVTKNGLGN